MDDGDKIIVVLGFFGFLTVVAFMTFAYFRSQPASAVSVAQPVAYTVPVYQRRVTKDDIERASQELKDA